MPISRKYSWCRVQATHSNLSTWSQSENDRLESLDWTGFSKRSIFRSWTCRRLWLDSLDSGWLTLRLKVKKLGLELRLVSSLNHDHRSYSWCSMHSFSKSCRGHNLRIEHFDSLVWTGFSKLFIFIPWLHGQLWQDLLDWGWLRLKVRLRLGSGLSLVSSLIYNCRSYSWCSTQALAETCLHGQDLMINYCKNLDWTGFSKCSIVTLWPSRQLWPDLLDQKWLRWTMGVWLRLELDRAWSTALHESSVYMCG